ncbi:MAG: AraC family transcriptional regulator, partial [Pseudomonadota bacterium]
MVCVVNPGEVHTGGGEAMSYWDLMPSAALLARAFPHTPISSLFLKDAVLAQPDVVAAIRRMFAAVATSCAPIVREQAVLEGLATLFASADRIAAGDLRTDPLPAAARMAQEYIEAHLDQTISLASLADVSGLSLFHFCRVFEAALGMPPGAYIR